MHGATIKNGKTLFHCNTRQILNLIPKHWGGYCSGDTVDFGRKVQDSKLGWDNQTS